MLLKPLQKLLQLPMQLPTHLLVQLTWQLPMHLPPQSPRVKSALPQGVYICIDFNLRLFFVF
jgi:hypothetical protein